MVIDKTLDTEKVSYCILYVKLYTILSYIGRNVRLSITIKKGVCSRCKREKKKTRLFIKIVS